MRHIMLAAALACGLAGAAAAQERFPELKLDQMTPEQRKVAEAIMAGPRGRMSGPFNAWLRSPEIADALQNVGAKVRYKSSIPPALNEFAILITAREWTSQYEWYAHHPLAMKAGLPPQVAAELAQGRKPEGMDADTALVWQFCTELHRNHVVSDATYAAARQRFGEQGVVDLIAVSGYYVTVSMTLNVAQVGLPPGVAPPLPELKK
ncbi:carboxymuconolactone decarboxylase family protein [Dankookia rubra]|uniref:Carboxymuconolactone decarboxylase family protein n=1 Tax=Dankookia rubra TaxID=1442381 RepID=A0A4R5QJP3_9PROT|nr:carboxymuconolactone decarboxylase family protein [Dankookia rubra]TDH63640.1 carboxymuconolactone decarboxylase family protein [Dankookia rubra]